MKKFKGALATTLMAVVAAMMLTACGGEQPGDTQIDVSIADEPEDVDTPDTDVDTTDDVKEADPNEIVFTNGKSFVLTKYEVEGMSGPNYKLKDTQSFLEPVSTTDISVSDAASTMADNMKADSGEAAVIDVHDEGTYITGLFQDNFDLVFLAEGDDGTTYILNLLTSDTENAIDIMNSVISDFLASDITSATGRTAYGEPVDEENDADGANTSDAGATSAGGEDASANAAVFDKSYKVPSGYDCEYTCEFFDTYGNGDYTYKFMYEVDTFITDIANGKTDKYLDYDAKVIDTFESASGTVSIVQTGETDYNIYIAVTKDGSIGVELRNDLGKEISNAKKMFQDVIK